MRLWEMNAGEYPGDDGLLEGEGEDMGYAGWGKMLDCSTGHLQ
jgi:hypothetical protein